MLDIDVHAHGIVGIGKQLSRPLGLCQRNPEIDIACGSYQGLGIKPADGPTFHQHRLNARRAQPRHHLRYLARDEAVVPLLGLVCDLQGLGDGAVGGDSIAHARPDQAHTARLDQIWQLPDELSKRERNHICRRSPATTIEGADGCASSVATLGIRCSSHHLVHSIKDTLLPANGAMAVL